MRKKKLLIAHRQANQRYRDKLKKSGLIRLHRYVTPEEKNYLDFFLEIFREFNFNDIENRKVGEAIRSQTIAILEGRVSNPSL